MLLIYVSLIELFLKNRGVIYSVLKVKYKKLCFYFWKTVFETFHPATVRHQRIERIADKVRFSRSIPIINEHAFLYLRVSIKRASGHRCTYVNGYNSSTV